MSVQLDFEIPKNESFVLATETLVMTLPESQCLCLDGLMDGQTDIQTDVQPHAIQVLSNERCLKKPRA